MESTKKTSNPFNDLFINNPNIHYKSKYFKSPEVSECLSILYKSSIDIFHNISFSKFDNIMLKYLTDKLKSNNSMPDIDKLKNHIMTMADISEEFKDELKEYHEDTAKFQETLSSYIQQYCLADENLDWSNDPKIKEAIKNTEALDQKKEPPKKPKVREMTTNEETGEVTIICKRHYYGEKYAATKSQRQFFRDLGGEFTGASSNNQFYKCVTKRDLSVGIDLLKQGKKVTIHLP